MNTGQMIILFANVPILIALGIVSVRMHRAEQRMEVMSNFLQMFTEATMEHIFKLRKEVFKEEHEHANK